MAEERRSIRAMHPRADCYAEPRNQALVLAAPVVLLAFLAIALVPVSPAAAGAPGGAANTPWGGDASPEHGTEHAARSRDGFPAQREVMPSACALIVDEEATTEVRLCDSGTVTVTAAISCPTKVPLHVVLVVGRHLAMQDHLEDVKQAARQVVDGLDFDAGTKVGVVSLSTQARIEHDLSDQKTQVLSAISRIRLDNISPFNRYYDWIGIAQQMLEEERGEGAPAREAIVMYTTGCPPGFDQYCNSVVGSSNRAQGEGITVVGVCNPNAMPFGLPLGDHCRWIRQVASTGYYHELRQASRVSSDLAELSESAKELAAESVMLEEILAPGVFLVPGSAAPAPAVSDGAARFTWEDLQPGERVTATYSITGSTPGRRPLRDGSTAWLRDSWDRTSAPAEVPTRTLAFVDCTVPSPSPTATTLTPSPAPTAPPATATVGPVGGALFLPVALGRACRPRSAYADVVLALDASTSMLDPDGATTKLAAAQAAAVRFVGLLDPGNRAAVVGFNSDAWVAAPLGSDQATLEGAIDGLSARVATGTRIERALGRSRAALDHGPDAANRSVVLLLSDGRPSAGRAAALDEAAAARSEGIVVYTIGLGDDVDAALLSALASRPELYRAAPGAADLEGIYEEIVADLPCPAGARW